MLREKPRGYGRKGRQEYPLGSYIQGNSPQDWAEVNSGKWLDSTGRQAHFRLMLAMFCVCLSSSVPFVQTEREEGADTLGRPRGPRQPALPRPHALHIQEFQ